MSQIIEEYLWVPVVIGFFLLFGLIAYAIILVKRKIDKRLNKIKLDTQQTKGMTDEEFENLVRRLEAYSSSNQSTYKLRVVLLASLGYFFIFAVLVVVTMFLAGIGYIFYSGNVNTLLIHLALKIGLPIVVLIYVVAKAIAVSIKEPEGLPLSREEYPALFKMLDKLRTRLAGPRFHRVLLNNEFNASVTQVPRLGMLGWQQNFLVMGLPLMQSLSPEQFVAVIAHEYGHLSGAHGKLSAWIYRLRTTWYNLMEALDKEESWSRAVFSRFFNWYSPFFNAYSFVLARSNEYEADQCSKDLVGADAAGAALIHVYTTQEYLDSSFWPKLYEQADTASKPGYMPFSALAVLNGKIREEKEMNECFQRVLERETGLDDTHPSLRDRLNHIGVDAKWSELRGPNAAQYLLGKNYGNLVKKYDSQWLEEITPWWEERFEYATNALARLAEYDQQAVEQLDEDQLWEYGNLAQEFRSAADAIPLYRACLEGNPDLHGVKFRLGAILLEQQEREGVHLVESAMEGAPGLIVDGCEVLYVYYSGKGDAEKARQYYEMGSDRASLEDSARRERSELRYDATLLEPGLDRAERDTLASDLRDIGGLKHVYVAKIETTYLPEEPLYVVGVERDNLAEISTRDMVEVSEYLANAVNFEYEAFFVVLEGANVKLIKGLKKLRDAKLY